MPKYYCDYCDTYLTHDSPSVRKTHCNGRKHKDNVRFYYQRWVEDQAQSLIDATTAAFKAGKIPSAAQPPKPPPMHPMVPTIPGRPRAPAPGQGVRMAGPPPPLGPMSAPMQMVPPGAVPPNVMVPGMRPPHLGQMMPIAPMQGPGVRVPIMIPP